MAPATLLFVCAAFALLAAPAEAGGLPPLAVARPPERPPAPATAAAVGAPSAPVHDFGLQPGESLHAVFHTDRGAIDCVLDTEGAPATVLAFTELATGARDWVDPRTGQTTRRPLYDGTVFHRVVPGFLIQGGDPTGTGAGGPGFSLPDEIATGANFAGAGILGLATRGRNTGGSQFFITDGPAHHLDGHYTRLGACGGLEVIRSIASVPRGERNRPTESVVLRTVEVVRR